jgi:hypothetical protein
MSTDRCLEKSFHMEALKAVVANLWGRRESAVGFEDGATG